MRLLTWLRDLNRRDRDGPSDLETPVEDIADLQATPEEIALAAQIVDPKFYLYRNDDVLASGKDPVEHFAAYGWRERRDPNPYTLVRFVLRHRPEVGESFDKLARHITGTIFHNPLLRKPATLAEIHSAMANGSADLDQLFIFDVAGYEAAQHDVLGFWPEHPVNHLFYDGLYQNRLRNGNHFDPLLLSINSYCNDYEMLISQTAPLSILNFQNLDLSPSVSEEKANLSKIKLEIGVVLYQNARAEIERLVRSVRSNAIRQPFAISLLILDNSPTSLDLEWLTSFCPGITVDIFRHPENVGFSQGHNSLMEKAFEAEGAVYLGLNPDGYLLPGSLNQLLRFYTAKRQPALIEMDSEPLSHPKWYHPVTGETDWVSGAAFLMDREAYESTGGFDPNFPMYCEDIDLSFRARMAGIGLYVCPRARYYHDSTKRLFTSETWRSKRMMAGTWYLCQRWGNHERANLIKAEMIRQGYDTSALGEAPEEISNVPHELRDLLTKDRFSDSRFWGG